MRIFVAGATGVLGRRLVPALLAEGHEVRAVARSAEKAAQLERAGATPVQLDLFDGDAVRRAVAGHEVVINVATHIPPNSRIFLPGAWRENDRIRGVASGILADAALAAGVARFVQESFAGAYPDRGGEWIDESVPLQPSRYNRTVLAAEDAAARFARGGGVGVVLRFAAFYGPDAAAFIDMVRLVRRGWAPIPGDGGAYISSVSHDDAAAAIVTALRVPPGVYNVVDDQPLPRRSWFDVLAAALDVRPPRLPPPWTARLMGSLGEMLARSQRLSNRKLRAAGGWAPRYPSVQQGFPATLRALRATGRTQGAGEAH